MRIPTPTEAFDRMEQGLQTTAANIKKTDSDRKIKKEKEELIHFLKGYGATWGNLPLSETLCEFLNTNFSVAGIEIIITFLSNYKKRFYRAKKRVLQQYCQSTAHIFSQ